jgi:hypothetical protein
MRRTLSRVVLGSPFGNVQTSKRFAGKTLLVVAAIALAAPAMARADLGDEQTLAERYAPVVRLVEQPDECGPGEPYEPTDVDLLFGNETVALRGTWNATDLVKIGPTAKDIAGLDGYHLDYPGNALAPGCDYEDWAKGLTEESKPTTYAHVASDPDYPGELSLQYWFFYPFNHWNNSHEGDWEMIQLDFDARDAREALSKQPLEVGYSSHEGAERAPWGDSKLELIDGTHPVVYPGAGSHANKFTAALYLGSTGDEGVGCDDTRGPHIELRPVVKTIPSDPVEAAEAFPWITFEGHWGEMQSAFYNGPTGPNTKQQWTAPIQWAQDWRERSYAVPTGGVMGTSATSFFCTGVAAGSRSLVQPKRTLLIVALLLALLIFAATRTTWRPAQPLRVARRRSWGKTLSAAGRMYVDRASLFLRLGLLFVPLGLLVCILQALVLGGFGLVGLDTTGESAGALVVVVVAVGTLLTLLGLTLVQAATACALVEIDGGRPIRALPAYRMALRKTRPLFGGLALAVGAWLLLGVTAVLTPVAIWLAVRWMLLAQAVVLEDRSARSGLARSYALVRGHWLRVASLVGVGAVLALAAGPLLGALLIFLTNAPLALVNVVAGVVYVLTMPFVALTTTYVYFDARVRNELEPEVEHGPLPAELELGTDTLGAGAPATEQG